jgi:hypothetical protein
MGDYAVFSLFPLSDALIACAGSTGSEAARGKCAVKKVWDG